MRRMWINQPSRHQDYHELHGTNVLADWHGYIPDPITIWFLSGDTISQQLPRSALSNGWLTWIKDKGDITNEYYK